MIDLKKSMNTSQYAAATTIYGPVLALAGAGSGKTRMLTYRIAGMIDKGINPARILAVTYTNKAAREMKERVEKLLGTANTPVTLSTFHSFGFRIVRDHYSELGFSHRISICDDKNQKQIIKKLLSNVKLSE